MLDPPLIIDDFFEDPYKIRNIALDLLKNRHSCILNDDINNYPGIRCYLPDEIHQHLKSIVENILKKKLAKFISSFHVTSSIHKCGLIHQDRKEIAGLVYLNENPPIKSGTILCECINKKNFRFVEEFPLASSTKDINTIKSFAKQKEEYNQKNFRVVQMIENKFNRFILYNGKAYHAPHNYFGNNLFNSRLVLVFWADHEI